MAAIDKMCLKDYCVFDEFRLWCLVHNPKLLQKFYHWNMTLEEWNDHKERVYAYNKVTNDRIMRYSSTVEDLREHYKQLKYDAPLTQLMSEVNACLKLNDALKDKENYIANYSIPVTNFSCKEDKYLLWHCPVEEVREYLTKQCGYKEKWYYKLFFKK